MGFLDRFKDKPKKPKPKEYTTYCRTCGRSYGGMAARFCMWCGKRLVWAERLEGGWLNVTDWGVQ